MYINRHDGTPEKIEPRHGSPWPATMEAAERTTHRERTEARIEEIKRSKQGFFPEQRQLQALARELADKLDAVEAELPQEWRKDGQNVYFGAESVLCYHEQDAQMIVDEHNEAARHIRAILSAD